MIGVLALRETPFSWLRFLGYLACLAALVVFSLWTEPSDAAREPLRLGRPVAELYPQLRQIGLPWYLRRHGATAEVSGDGASEWNFDVEIAGHRLGRYVERLERLDDDRTKLRLSFEPAEAQVVAALAAPVKSSLAPADLMSEILKEHVRSELARGGFNLDALQNRHSPLIALTSRFLDGMHPCPPPKTDDFELCGDDAEAARVRHAYIAAGLR